jgi:Flp pilus assembly protein TadD
MNSRTFRFQNSSRFLTRFAVGAFVFVLAAGARPAGAQSSGFWVWNGTSLTRVYDDNTSQFVVREWQVWLYNMGQPTGGKNYWGMMSGRTSAEVMQKLKNDQESELRSNNFFGNGRVPSQKLGHFNPLGPIAVVERPSPKPKPAPKPAAGAKPRPAPAQPKPEARWGDPDFHLGKDFLDDDLRRKRDAVKNAWGGILNGKDDLDNIRNTFNSILREVNNPFSSAGGNLNGMIDAWIDAAYKLQQAKRMLDQINNPAIAGIDGVLGEFSRDLDRIAADLASARGRINAIPVGMPQQVETLPAQVPQPDGAMTPEEARDVLIRSLGTPYIASGVAGVSIGGAGKNRADFSTPGRVAITSEFGNTVSHDLASIQNVENTQLAEHNPKLKWLVVDGQRLEHKFNIYIPNGTSSEQAKRIKDAFVIHVLHTQGKSKTTSRPAAPKPAPNAAQPQMKQQLLDSLASMEKQIAQVKGQRAALQPSNGALIAPNVPEPVAQRIQATQEKLAYTSLSDVYKNRLTGADGKEAAIFDVEGHRAISVNDLLSNLHSFDSTKSHVAKPVLKVAAGNYRSEGTQESIDVVFTMTGMATERPHVHKLISLSLPFREKWNVAPNGARRMTETVFLGDVSGNGRSELDWAPPSTQKVQQAHVFYLTGIELQKNSKYAEAETAFREAVRLSPNDGDLYFWLGVMLHHTKRLDEAEAVLRNAATRIPERADIGDWLGRTLRAQEKYSDAEEAHRIAVRLDPNNGSYRNSLGVTLSFLQRWGQAEEQFREYVRLAPKDGQAFANLASALLRQERKDEARTMAQKAIELGEKDHWVFKELGLTPPA